MMYKVEVEARGIYIVTTDIRLTCACGRDTFNFFYIRPITLSLIEKKGLRIWLQLKDSLALIDIFFSCRFHSHRFSQSYGFYFHVLWHWHRAYFFSTPVYIRNGMRYLAVSKNVTSLSLPMNLFVCFFLWASAFWFRQLCPISHFPNRIKNWNEFI